MLLIDSHELPFISCSRFVVIYDACMSSPSAMSRTYCCLFNFSIHAAQEDGS